MSRQLASTRDAYGKTLVELGKQNRDIVVLDADLACSTKTASFCKAFPDRFINCGVAEQDMISTAAGLAASGKIAFASTFAVFGAGRAWDQVRISVAYPRLNVKIVVTHGGITVGEDGATHHALEDICLMRVLPNMTVVVPADAVETEKAIRAVAQFHGPAYVRLGRSAVPVINQDKDYDFRIGKSVEFRKGKDVTLIACGIMVATALDAADILEKEGLSCRVINMHTIKPLDREAVLSAARETGAIVTAEEHSVLGGLGSAVCETVAQDFPVPVIRVGVADMFTESGSPSELLEKYGLMAKDIIDAAKKAISKKR
ncbi:MAG: transketolase family protein [Candidatus Saganbacteria bacterium]|nr:transketolase family protein [Candidatus Saganbacteria bacterium]